MTYQSYRGQPPFDPADDPMLEPARHGVRDAGPTPEQARFFARMRWMMVISGAATILGIAVVLGVIGYRVFKSDGSAPPDVTELLPKGAKIIGTAVAGERIAIMIDAGGSVEVRTFDLKSLKPSGRLKFAAEP
jgi:hypothetical protein